MNIGELRVSDCMERQPSTVDERATTRETLEALRASGGRAVVVTGPEGTPIGIVSEGDLLRRILAIEVPSGAQLRRVLSSLDAALEHVAERRRAHGHHARDIMTSPLITVRPSDSLLTATQLFQQHRLHQLPVIEDGRLAGVLHLHEMVAYIIERQDAWAEELLGDDEGGTGS